MKRQWTMETFPKDKPVWIRRKDIPGAFCQVLSISYEGVQVLGGDNRLLSIPWADLFIRCVQVDGSVCGIDK